MGENLYCIRRTATIEEADVVVAWLEDRGIEATVMDRDNPGVFAFGLTDTEGVAICVSDEATAEKGQTLLVEHDRERDLAMVKAAADDDIEIACEECGQVNFYPAELTGTTQQCVGCNEYLDVPGGAAPEDAESEDAESMGVGDAEA